MNPKQLSHDKYNNLPDDKKKAMRERAISKLPDVLKKSESAIMSQIYMYIRTKLWN